MNLDVHVLVLAKAPVAGRVKTRLGATVGMAKAADVAAASLLDTLAVVRDAVPAPDHRHLALAGSLLGAARSGEVADALDGWSVRRQRGDGLGERLAHAHREVPGPVLQVGMDTPQLTPGHLAAAAAALADADAVLGPADDGGWWLLGLQDPRCAEVLAAVPMSASTTYDDTRAALGRTGLTVTTLERMRDVDEADDADAVAAIAPATRFAEVWRGLA